MNPERWQAVGDLFDKALALPDAERTACIVRESNGDEELRREVMSLIASHRKAPGGFVQDQIKVAVLAFQDVSERHDTRIGPYRLISELGRGGQGTLFLAEYTRILRRHALKVLSSRYETIRHDLSIYRDIAFVPKN